MQHINVQLHEYVQGEKGTYIHYKCVVRPIKFATISKINYSLNYRE